MKSIAEKLPTRKRYYKTFFFFAFSHKWKSFLCALFDNLHEIDTKKIFFKKIYFWVLHPFFIDESFLHKKISYMNFLGSSTNGWAFSGGLPKLFGRSLQSFVIISHILEYTNHNNKGGANNTLGQKPTFNPKITKLTFSESHF